MKLIKSFILTLVLSLTIFSCNEKKQSTSEVAESISGEKIGVLLVNHGSHSKQWRTMLTDIEKDVKGQIMKSGEITEVRTAFMEYTEPSIASQMKKFDEENYDRVIVVPIFLTISSHTSNDIPNIVGLANDPKVKEELKAEGIETYSSKARVTVTPLLDYPTVLKKNITRRAKALSNGSGDEGVALIAYGDAEFNQQWEEMVEDIGRYLKAQTGIGSISYGWCGHLVRYSSEPTKKAIDQILELEERAIVIPVLVANDEHFQGEIIQNGVDMVEDQKRVVYKQDAILPDPNINKWVVKIVDETMTDLRGDKEVATK
ncbi:sirohydrochlorin chelatase [Flammeovirga pacifica]|uniref:Cobalamin biosynthesis protein CbiX n=1 Tax=Flammeovirga pacifica TaxID=915059 RepID=A0A1S1Z3J1_FLAPC|nr:CbiX/SirB N-terminal domain-containing protein [Flammeovirga pacifica]OHX67854.1 cobalamin biosynthesis protein CbiX [Flammeovirga pacifica]